MDIENMHPFCLPFGFCHDATSSSIANNDFPTQQQQTSNESTTSNNNNINNINNNNNNNTKDKINRSKTSSPSTDDFFKQLNNGTTTSLLRDEDIIIGSSSSIDFNGSCIDVESFCSLDLDLNGYNEESDNNNGSHEGGGELGAFTDEELLEDDVDITTGALDDEDDLIITKNGTIDWYSTSCNQYSSLSLFSPLTSLGGLNSKFNSATKNGRRKSIFRQALLSECNNPSNNQVFHQHVVDPLDIKSSPTLAQLNLNSINDDPTDPGFWMDTPPPGPNNGVTISSSTTALSSTNHHHSSQDLLISNSTSILNNQHHLHHYQNHHQHHPNPEAQSNGNISSSLSCSCNHLNHTQHQQHLDSFKHPAHLSNVSSSLSSHHHLCNHNQLHNHNNDHQQLNGRFNVDSFHHHDTASTHQSSTCLAVAPFRRSETQAHFQPYSSSTCCHQHNLISAIEGSQDIRLNLHQSTNINNNNNLKPSATLNQLNQLNHQPQISQNSSLPLNVTTNATTSSLDEKQKLDQQHQRSASPALVTSSSSPLSTAIHHPLQETPISPSVRLSGVMAHGPNGNRLIDNKLKENIEYLTALLCNGNGKLETNCQQSTQQQQQLHNQQQQQQQQQQQLQQQATISSTMARSYATLAQSLSTEPKLLERQHLNINNVQQQQQTQPITQLNIHPPPHHHCLNPSNEASPCVHQQHQNIMSQQPNSLKRPFPDTCTANQNQWFNNKQLAVESSVSAADSTESQVSSLSNEARLMHPQIVDGQRNKTNNLKVLSSLLNSSNKQPQQGCIAPHHPQLGPSMFSTNHTNWSVGTPVDQQNVVNILSGTGEITKHHNINQAIPIPPMKQSLTKSQQETSTPINGKPITLTPISNQANLIKQSQQQTRPVLFAQPASPSASSTASSCNNTIDSIGSSSSNTTTTTTVKATATSGAKKQKAMSTTISSGKNSNRSCRPNSMSTECSLSSHDEGFSSQVEIDDNNSMHNSDDDDDDDDVDSDDESFYGDYTNSDLIGASISDNAENKWTLNMGRTRRNGQKRYFWQYNVQSKGPKGTRICSTDDSEDPFVLPEASDPVFSNDCQVEGVKHSGKARRGDGNDLTPNPRKLLMIGLELKKLGKIINELAPVTDLPINARNKTRKEKNKLASRACRLKKKAQHEANKIKLYGLQREHQQVVLAIYEIRKLLNETLLERETKEKLDKRIRQEQIEQKLNFQHDSIETVKLNDNGGTSNNKNINSSVSTIAEQCVMKVAGQTSDYVNSVLEKVVSGCIDGGLQT